MVEKPIDFGNKRKRFIYREFRVLVGENKKRKDKPMKWGRFFSESTFFHGLCSKSKVLGCIEKPIDINRDGETSSMIIGTSGSDGSNSLDDTDELGTTLLKKKKTSTRN